MTRVKWLIAEPSRRLGALRRLPPQLMLPTCLLLALSCAASDRTTDGHGGISGIDLPVHLIGPAKLAVGSNYLAIGDSKDTVPLQLYPLAGGKGATLLSDPDEPRYSWITSLQFRTDRRGEGLWLSDTRLGVLVRYAINGAGRLAIDTSYDVPVGGTPLGTYWLDDTLLVTSGIFTEPSRLYLWTPSTKVPRAWGLLPYLTSGTPVFPLQQALQPSFAVHPTDHLVAVAPLFAGRLDIYRISSDTETVARTPHAFDPLLRVGLRGTQAQFVQDAATRAGYISVSATASHIYALFSGVSRSAAQHGWLPGSLVDVFDWHGRFIRSIRLDRDALEIAVSPRETAIYATVIQPSRGKTLRTGVRQYDITQAAALAQLPTTSTLGR